MRDELAGGWKDGRTSKKGHDGVDGNGIERLARNLASIRNRIAACTDRPICLVAVTKTVVIDVVRALYDLGHRDFGESRPQLLWERKPMLPADARWHLIGPLQTNKVRRTLPAVELLHSLDRESLVDAIAAEAVKAGLTVRATIEINLTGETNKSGFTAEAIRAFYPKLVATPGIELAGAMAMARLDYDQAGCRAIFRQVRELRDELRDSVPNGPALSILSMGMSNDFEAALAEGATLVRIGSLLFDGLPEVAFR